MRSVAALLGFVQDDDIVPAVKSESLFDFARDFNIYVAPGDAKLVAENPEPPAAIVNQENTLAHDGERIHHPAGDADLFTVKSAGIVVNRLDAFGQGASGDEAQRD